MQIRVANPGLAMLQGSQAAQGINAANRERELNNFFANQGAALMSGDQGALNAFAALDPMAAFQFQNAQLDRQIKEKRLATMGRGGGPSKSELQAANFRTEFGGQPGVNAGSTPGQRPANAFSMGEVVTGDPLSFGGGSLAIGEAVTNGPAGEAMTFEAAAPQDGFSFGETAPEPVEAPDPVEYARQRLMRGYELFAQGAIHQNGVKSLEAQYQLALDSVPEAEDAPTFRPATPEEASAFGAAAGQIDTSTGRFYPVAQPRNTVTELGPDGTFRIVEGTGPASQPKTTEGEKSAAGYLSRMRAAEAIMDELAEDGPVVRSMASLLMAGTNFEGLLLDERQERILQAQRDWVRAKLRKESGAVIGQEEMAEEILTFFPLPGESERNVEQKRQARLQAERQLEIMSGNAAQQAGDQGSQPQAPDPVPGTQDFQQRTNDLLRQYGTGSGS